MPTFQFDNCEFQVRSGLNRRASTRVEVFVAIVCVLVLLVLAVILLNVRTGPRIQARQSRDSTHVRAIVQTWWMYSREFDGRMPVPGLVDRLPIDGVDQPGRGEEDIALNTTANLFSLCIMQNYIPPDVCISPVESNPVVKALADDGYDYTLYSPGKSIYWDSAFEADLQKGSNVSYAHMPLHGRLKIDHWRETLNTGATWPLIGNRGPLNGANDPNSFTFKFYDPADQWGGNIGFADGHVEFLQGLPSTKAADGRTVNTQGLFIYDGENDADGILTFTREMKPDGPVLQHD